MTFCKLCGNTGKIRGMGGMKVDCDHPDLKNVVKESIAKDISDKDCTVIKKRGRPKQVK